MKHTLRKINIILCFTFLSVCVSLKHLDAQEIKQDTKLSADSILVGERVVFNTIFTVPEGTSIKLLPYNQTLVSADTIARVGNDTTLARLSQLEILKEIKLDTLHVKKGINELEAKVMITSFDTGVFKLPKPQILIGDKLLFSKDIQFDDKLLTVSTIPIDTATFVMEDIKGQMTYPITFKEILPWILLVLFVTLFAFLVYRYIVYKKNNKNFFGKIKPIDPPHIIALRELEHIRNEKLWQTGKEKLYYTGITDTLRSYIEKRFQLNAKEKTSKEILEDMKSVNLDKKSYEELENLFAVSDLVKFAKYTPTIGENEEAVPVAVRFVNSTFLSQINEEKREHDVERNVNDEIKNELEEKGE